jgi:hypothetical protein
MDSDPDPKMDLNLIKNHQKISNLIKMTFKIHKSNIFFEKYALKYREKIFKIIGIVKD